MGALEPFVGSLHNGLSEIERARAAAFRFEHHRRAYVVAHGVLRDVLARYVDSDRAGIDFDVTDAGRPYLRAGDIDFNLSHAGDAVVVAVASGQRVGVDLEEVKVAMEHDALAARFFAPPEIDEIRSGGARAQPGAFFACWTKKEAIVKAVGRGLQMPLDSFNVVVGALHQRVTVGRDGAWTLVDLGLSSGYAGAVAMENETEVKSWMWRPSSSQGRL